MDDQHRKANRRANLERKNRHCEDFPECVNTANHTLTVHPYYRGEIDFSATRTVHTCREHRSHYNGLNNVHVASAVARCGSGEDIVATCEVPAVTAITVRHLREDGTPSTRLDAIVNCCAHHLKHYADSPRHTIIATRDIRPRKDREGRPVPAVTFQPPQI